MPTRSPGELVRLPHDDVAGMTISPPYFLTPSRRPPVAAVARGAACFLMRHPELLRLVGACAARYPRRRPVGELPSAWISSIRSTSVLAVAVFCGVICRRFS